MHHDNHNRNVVVMGIAKGRELSKTKVLDPEWFLDRIIEQVGSAYSRGIVHADLSEYNVFVSDEGVTIIDWPQYVEVGRPQADELLKRDITNVLAFFKRKYGIKRNAGVVLELIRKLP